MRRRRRAATTTRSSATPIRTFTLGLTNNGRWGQFDASWLWRAEFGQDVFNNTALVYSTKSNVLQDRNFLASALSDPDAASASRRSTRRAGSRDGSLRAPAERHPRLHVQHSGGCPVRPQRLRVFVSGDNLLLFTGYTGYDPEVFVRAGPAYGPLARHRLPHVSARPDVHDRRARSSSDPVRTAATTASRTSTGSSS